MKRILFVVIALSAISLAASVLLYAQQQRGPYQTHVPFEVRTVFPRETSPGFYKQVEERELETVAEEGWELVGVTPYIYRNEERGSNNPKAVVTQTYPAYFFKRAKMIR